MLRTGVHILKADSVLGLYRGVRLLPDYLQSLLQSQSAQTLLSSPPPFFAN